MKDLSRWKPPEDIERLPELEPLTDEDLGLVPRGHEQGDAVPLVSAAEAAALEARGDACAVTGDWLSARDVFQQLADARSPGASPLLGLKLACALRGVGDYANAEIQYFQWSTGPDWLRGSTMAGHNAEINAWLDRWDELADPNG